MIYLSHFDPRRVHLRTVFGGQTRASFFSERLEEEEGLSLPLATDQSLLKNPSSQSAYPTAVDLPGVAG